MNGHVANALILIIGALLGLVQVLFGLVLKAHKERDDERIAQIQAEILRLRDKLDDERERK